MINYHFLTVFLIISLICSNSMAQQKEETETIDFDKSDVTKPSQQLQQRNSPANSAVWIDVISAIEGRMSVSYEREMSNRLSFEVGGGITLPATFDDIGQALTSHIYSPKAAYDGDVYFKNKGYSLESTTGLARIYANSSHIGNQTYNFGSHATQNIGYYVFVEPKYFPSNSEVFAGTFIGVRTQFAHLNYTSEKPEQLNNNTIVKYSTVEKISSYRQNLDILPVIGYEGKIANNFMMAYQCGMGLRWSKTSSYDIGRDLSNSSMPYEIRTDVIQTGFTPAFDFSVRVGYCF